MSDYLPQEIRDQLVEAHRAARRKRAKRSVHIGADAFAILEMSDTGFAVDMIETPPLRGFIDIYEGATHLYQALIVAAATDGDLMRYEFKRNTAAARVAPVDFERPHPEVAGLLSKA
ncbi:hypothetical protein V8J82_09130 [Gymnodinialimonas sp. 2305UL16-5]|uniref:hypothetical protein n=1 Tax=Gymnodinialimonas mytili TaxID=3126503 RepID=UPI0030AACD6C